MEKNVVILHRSELDKIGFSDEAGSLFVCIVGECDWGYRNTADRLFVSGLEAGFFSTGVL